MNGRTKIVAAVLCVLICALTLTGCSNNEKAIGTCCGYDVLYEELRFVTMTYKTLLDTEYGDGNAENGTIWDDVETAEQYRAELEEAVWSTLRSNYTTLVACYENLLTVEDLKSDVIQDAVDELYDSMITKDYDGDEKAFKEDLEASYMTENLFRFFLATDQMKNELYYVLTQDLATIVSDSGEFYDWLKDGNCVYVQHIFIGNDEGDDPAENLALAQEVQQSIANGSKTIDDYVGSAKYNEDTSNAAPYYLVRDLYDETLVEAGLQLENAGDVSPVISTENGYYVMVRMEDSNEKLLSNVPNLLYYYQWTKVGEYIDTFADDVSIELNDYGKSIDLLEIK